MARFAIVVNLNRCIGCHGCEVACKAENNVALGQYWNRLIDCGPYGDYPDIEMYFMPIMCQQCANAPCIDACPVGASMRDGDGVVVVDSGLCIGCQMCMDACPYNVRSYNPAKNVVEKCTLCSQLREEGAKPLCVSTCATGARCYGDLDDPQSDASKALAAADPADVHYLPDNGNGPLTCYILSPSRAAWRGL